MLQTLRKFSSEVPILIFQSGVEPNFGPFSHKFFIIIRRRKNKGPLKSDPLNLRPPDTDLPSGKIRDGIFLQAGLAVFAFRGCARSNKNIAAPFKSCRKQSSLLAWA